MQCHLHAVFVQMGWPARLSKSNIIAGNAAAACVYPVCGVADRKDICGWAADRRSDVDPEGLHQTDQRRTDGRTARSAGCVYSTSVVHR